MPANSTTYFALNVIDPATQNLTQITVRGIRFVYDSFGQINDGAVGQMSVRTTLGDGVTEWTIFRDLSQSFASLAGWLQPSRWDASEPIRPVLAYPNTGLQTTFSAQTPGFMVSHGSTQGDRIAPLAGFVWPEISYGAAGNDTLIGTAGGDSLFGGDGFDLLAGMAGSDTLNGDAGNDSLYGGLGTDIMDGGAANDRLSGGDGDDLFRGQAGDDLIIGGDGCDSVDAGFGDDSVYGGAGNDVVFGFVGNDTIYAGDGNDTVAGGEGDDLIRLGAGDDSTFNASANPFDVVTGNDTVMGNDGNDHLDGGIGADWLYGGAGNDRLSGLSGSDMLRGGVGDDVLVAGADTDWLYGGAGADLFVFLQDSVGTAVTVICDFTYGLDRLRVATGPVADLTGAFDAFMTTALDTAQGVLWVDAFGATVLLQGITLAELAVGDILPGGSGLDLL